jgi:hypothetical protein
MFYTLPIFLSMVAQLLCVGLIASHKKENILAIFRLPLKLGILLS